MEIFKYTPNWPAIERRQKMKISQTEERAQRLPLNNDRFYYKEESKNKKDETLCTICKKSVHFPAICPEKIKKKQEKPEESTIYTPIFNFTPTTVKLTNVPVETIRSDIKDFLIRKNIQFDAIIMVTDKANREDFKGTIYIELPTESIAEKCVAVFDRMKMGVQIISATTVEGRQKL
ncbi:hypothetical protein NEIG_02371 [Nematocida sp. ERTm5]|nr:hypothetical protein NEIG_02371 [Nematocida sp. ERTm5]